MAFEEKTIRIEKLRKTFGGPGGRPVTALEDVSLEVASGEVLALVGASGCGKSTLLRIIAGLELEHEGSVEVGGVPVRGPGLDRGIVFQEHRLLPWLTVAKNVAFGVADLPRPRDRTTWEFARLRKSIYREFFEGEDTPAPSIPLSPPSTDHPHQRAII